MFYYNVFCLLSLYFFRFAGGYSYLTFLFYFSFPLLLPLLNFPGMSFYLFLIGICFLVGTAAIPAGIDDNAIGNIGTTTTCSIQGFLIHLGSMISISYYCCFSVYSFVGVLHNFEKNKISWIEKYIHIGVHVYPISSAIFLAYIEGLNSTGIGFCHIGSSLLGCSGWFESRQDEDDTGIDDDKCDRGPEKLTIIRYTLWTLPLLLCLICTTTTMILLYLKVKQKQDQIYIHSNTVAYQSIIYLSTLYATLLPLLVTHLVILLRVSTIIVMSTVAVVCVRQLKVYTSFLFSTNILLLLLLVVSIVLSPTILLCFCFSSLSVLL